MNTSIRNIMERHGQKLIFRTAAGETEAQAFLQPAVKRTEQVPDGMCGIGALDGRLWVYLGQENVQPGDQILWDGMLFRVRSSRKYALGEESLYWWASLEQEREAAE